MAGYSVKLQRTADPTKSVGNLVADPTTPKRGKLFRLIFGSEATPADAAFLWQLQACTTAGTATAVTPRKLDPGSSSPINKANENHTVDPTLTPGEIPLTVPLHQRATFNLYLTPGRELVYPAVANNGLAVRTPTANTVLVSATVHYEED